MHLRALGAALIATTAISAFFATSALAAATSSETRVASWVNAGGTVYAQGEAKEMKCHNSTVSVENTSGVSSANLQLTGTILGSPAWLTATGVECVGATITNTTVGGVHMAVDAGRLRFTGVTVMEPEGCVVDEGANLGTFTTEPLTTTLEMDTAEHTVAIDKFTPTTGTKLATIKLRGAKCAAEGNYPAEGFFVGRAVFRTVVRNAEQPLIFDKVMAESSGLILAGKPADIFGEVVYERANGEAFGAEEK
jgi:hypothetical protein